METSFSFSQKYAFPREFPRLLRKQISVPSPTSLFFYLALLAVVLGAMFFLAGFLGEMVSRSAAPRNDYNVKARF
jgi:hypothetical protein